MSLMKWNTQLNLKTGLDRLLAGAYGVRVMREECPRDGGEGVRKSRRQVDKRDDVDNRPQWKFLQIILAKNLYLKTKKKNKVLLQV